MSAGQPAARSRSELAWREVSGLAGADVNLEAETPHVFLRMNEKWFY
jgi:hypothetical protein